MSLDNVLSFHANRLGLSPKASMDRLSELEKFFKLIASDHKRRVVSEPVDEFWHDFLMFTEEYSGFCNRTVGAFVHHIPATTTPPSGYLDTRKEMETWYGALSEELWPREERLAWSEGYIAKPTRQK